MGKRGVLRLCTILGAPLRPGAWHTFYMPPKEAALAVQLVQVEDRLLAAFRERHRVIPYERAYLREVLRKAVSYLRYARQCMDIPAIKCDYVESDLSIALSNVVIAENLLSIQPPSA